VKCDDQGNVDLADLAPKAAEHADRLACVMVTYPSTHGVFEEGIKELCEVCTGTAARCTWTAPTSTRRWASAAPGTSAPTSAT
jgi:hypothetical protein